MRVPRPGDEGRPYLNAECLAAIGHSLRSFYRGVVKQPIPEHLARILDRIESPPAAVVLGWDRPSGAPGRSLRL
jgi:hypothetical protein